MNRRTPLERKTPLRRGDTPLSRRVPLKARTGLTRRSAPTGGQALVRRKEIVKVSEQRREDNRERARRQRAAWGPRPWPCQFPHDEAATRWPQIAPRCLGAVNGHELLKRSRGGDILDVDGQTPVCNVSNDWVENYPIQAAALGLSLPSGPTVMTRTRGGT